LNGSIGRDAVVVLRIGSDAVVVLSINLHAPANHASIAIGKIEVLIPGLVGGRRVQLLVLSEVEVVMSGHVDAERGRAVVYQA
jgi:hypothetical protein